MASFNKTVTVISGALSAAPAWGISAPASVPPAKAPEILFSALRREMRGDFIGCEGYGESNFSQGTASRVNLQEDATAFLCCVQMAFFNGPRGRYTTSSVAHHLQGAKP
jgi:hypothetical protein